MYLALYLIVFLHFAYLQPGGDICQIGIDFIDPPDADYNSTSEIYIKIRPVFFVKVIYDIFADRRFGSKTCRVRILAIHVSVIYWKWSTFTFPIIKPDCADV